MDCGLDMKTCSDLGATGTPNIMLFLPGARWTNYHDVPKYALPMGELTRDAFMAWLNPKLADYEASLSEEVDLAQTQSKS